MISTASPIKGNRQIEDHPAYAMVAFMLGEKMGIIPKRRMELT